MDRIDRRLTVRMHPEVHDRQGRPQVTPLTRITNGAADDAVGPREKVVTN
jgi:hypothetical protein